MSISNQVAVITGASRGLGKAIAQRLAQAGCHVALIARSRDELTLLANELSSQHDIKAEGFVCDLSQQADIFNCSKAILDTFGQVNILVNNAGTGAYKPFMEHSPEEHDAIIDVNFKAAVHLSYALLPQMLERKQGQIINIASDLACRPLANMAVYSASKFAMRGFSLSLLREVKNQGINVGLLSPGIIDTCFNNATPGSKPPSGALQPLQLAKTVYQMLTQPEFQLIDELTIHPQMQDF